MNEYWLFQLPLNVSPKKTAMMPRIHGVDAASFKRSLFNNGQMSSNIQFDCGVVDIPIVEK